MSRLGTDDIEAAAALLADVVDPTPVGPARALSELVGGPVLLKCENLQRTGSFKVRGAYVRIARLSDAERAPGVVAASAGNHAQGVALAAAALGCRCTVFMPEGASLPKVTATAAYGADVRLVGTVLEEALQAALDFAADTGAVVIHPYDHLDVVAGQGTIGLEILEQVPDVRTIVTPTGGGGLVAGIATAVQDAGVHVVGVQTAAVPSYIASLEAGEPTTVPPRPTMADGIAVARPGDAPFAVVRDLGVAMRTVDEPQIAAALLHCLERLKLVVEPAGVVGVAELLTRPELLEPPVVVVLSGGNVDPLLLIRVLRSGLASEGRFLQLRVRLPDSPGALAGLLSILAAARANTISIEHHRIDARLGLDEVEVWLELETRGPAHCDDLVVRLADAGYRVTRE